MRSPRALLLLLLVFAPVDSVRAATEDQPTGRFDAHVELPSEPPYVGEPLRLVLRFAVHGRVTADSISQPALTDFDWQQFGVDASSDELIDGFWTPVVQRVLMIYPLRAGRLTIPPFKLRIGYLQHDNDTGHIEFSSQPVEIAVRARDGVGEPGSAWLPAKSLRITDRWEPEPDKIPLGETAKRTVTVEAEGLTADRLPPLQSFRAPGVITFAGPVERHTIVTDAGPIARAVYRWNVRLVTKSAATAPAIRLPWFDISTRRMREVTSPERRIAPLDTTAAAAEATQAPRAFALLSPLPLIAAALGFVAGAAAHVALSLGGANAGSWRRFLAQRKLLKRLAAAARSDDLAAFHTALRRLGKEEPDRWRHVAAQVDVAEEIANVEKTLFGRDAPAPAPNLVPLTRRITTSLRSRRNDSP